MHLETLCHQQEPHAAAGCQSACKIHPLSASKFACRNTDSSNAAEGAGTGAGLGAAGGGVLGLLTGLGLMAIPGVGPVVAAGWLAATAAGAAAGAVAGGAAGGIIGALPNSGVNEEDAHVYAEGVRRGGTLVTARMDDSLALQAEAILQERDRVDPAVRRSIYAEEGWSRFDENADPYTLDQVERERERYRTMMP
ncbi:hypothetical protein [Sinorhizobium fredii]|uniref:hypothetical protein n=1 Tax=Rhizobium fredii TaxID=380 RepID=UPI00351102F0